MCPYQHETGAGQLFSASVCALQRDCDSISNVCECAGTEKMPPVMLCCSLPCFVLGSRISLSCGQQICQTKHTHTHTHPRTHKCSSAKVSHVFGVKETKPAATKFCASFCVTSPSRTILGKAYQFEPRVK